jgi:hypothetical protein
VQNLDPTDVPITEAPVDGLTPAPAPFQTLPAPFTPIFIPPTTIVIKTSKPTKEPNSMKGKKSMSGKKGMKSMSDKKEMKITFDKNGIEIMIDLDGPNQNSGKKNGKKNDFTFWS